MENYLVQVNKQFIVVKAADDKSAREQVLKRHIDAKSVWVIDKVENVLDFLKPYITISKHVQM